MYCKYISFRGCHFLFVYMAINVYLDESGDLGWNFDNPYKKGGSSRYLTIAFISCPSEKTHFIKRLVKDVYIKFNKDAKVEFKASMMSNEQKKFISKKTIKLLESHPDIKIGSITVFKPNVFFHIREDSNKLYNYMLRLSVLDYVWKHPVANLIRDNRSVKVKSGNSLVDYLQMILWFDMHSSTKIIDMPSDSKSVKNLIFIDWINNIVWGNYENKNNEPYDILKSKIEEKNLYFNS